MSRASLSDRTRMDLYEDFHFLNFDRLSSRGAESCST